MTRTVHSTASYLLIALGAVHTALTPVFYTRLTPNAMWFAGAGLAMIFVGFLNVILSSATWLDRLSRALVYVANLLTLGFGSVTIYLDGEPQVVFGMLLIATITVSAFLLKRAAPKGSPLIPVIPSACYLACPSRALNSAASLQARPSINL